MDMKMNNRHNTSERQEEERAQREKGKDLMGWNGLLWRCWMGDEQG